MTFANDVIKHHMISESISFNMYLTVHA